MGGPFGSGHDLITAHFLVIKEGTLFIGGGGGGGLGLQRGGSSVKFWSNEGGSRFYIFESQEDGHAFRFRKHKICNCQSYLTQLNVSLTPWFTTCTFSTVNS